MPTHIFVVPMHTILEPGTGRSVEERRDRITAPSLALGRLFLMMCTVHSQLSQVHSSAAYLKEALHCEIDINSEEMAVQRKPRSIRKKLKHSQKV